MRSYVVAFTLLFTCTAYVRASDQPQEPGFGEYARKAVAPAAVGRAALGAAITQGTNTPSEWGQGVQGFAKRLGSAFVKHLVKKGIQASSIRSRG